MTGIQSFTGCLSNGNGHRGVHLLNARASSAASCRDRRAS